MLYLVGLGLYDENDLTKRALDAMKKCDKIYLEMFTGAWRGDINKLDKMIGKKIVLIKREEVESDLLIREAKNNKIALLVPGDPLSGTTHIELFLEARKKKINLEIIHASSIFTAVAETGLQLYKFGRTTTLSKMGKNFKPSSPFGIIKENKKSGLHALILLDTGMTAKEGLEILNNNGFENEMIVACCNIGGKNKIIEYGKISDLAKDKKLEKSPAVLAMPGKVHFKEEEALELWKQS